MSKRKTKGDAQRRHARRRAVERYGFCPHQHQLHELVKQIQQNKATFLERQSCRVSLWEVVTHEGMKCRVVYDRQRANIVTFLPPVEAEELEVA